MSEDRVDQSNEETEGQASQTAGAAPLVNHFVCCRPPQCAPPICRYTLFEDGVRLPGTLKIHDKPTPKPDKVDVEHPDQSGTKHPGTNDDEEIHFYRAMSGGVIKYYRGRLYRNCPDQDHDTIKGSYSRMRSGDVVEILQDGDWTATRPPLT